MEPEDFAVILYHLIRNERKNDRVCSDLADAGDIPSEGWGWMQEWPTGNQVVVRLDNGEVFVVSVRRT